MKEKIELTQEEKNMDIGNEAIIADYQNKLKELDNFIFQVEGIDSELLRVDREIEIFKQLSDIILEKYSKDFDKCEFDWEKKPEYWEAKKAQEQISIERKLYEFEVTKRKLNNQRFHVLDQIESLEASIKIIEEKEL